MQKIERFSEGLKTCNVCREKADDTSKHIRKIETDDPRNTNQEWRQTHMSKVKEEVITCKVCNCEIKKYKEAQNEKSQTHQYNLKKLEDPGFESDAPKPNAIKLIDGKERSFGKTCRLVYLPFMWKQYFEKQQRSMFVKKQKRRDSRRTRMVNLFNLLSHY